MGNTPSRQCELEIEEKTVFLTGKKVYRIPALFYDRDSKSLLAFAERRKTRADTSTEVLVMKTGMVIKAEDTHEVTIKWSQQKVVEEALLEGYRPMNPCPVYEKTSKTLFLFFTCVEGTVSEQWQIRHCCNKTRLCYITTTDAGESWSPVTDLTDLMAEIKQWATFGVGPGHGIQTESGRLIVPVYAYAPDSRWCCSPRNSYTPYALSLHSDDNGSKWHFGKMLKNESLECEMAEFSDGTDSFIYCNARSKGGHRDEAFSKNKGDDFYELSPGKLVETGSGCQGSLVSFPAQSDAAYADNDPNKWLLYSHPSNKSKRFDLGVYLNKSPKDQRAWSEPWIINEGPSGYSDLAYIDDGWFACLLECGKKCETEQIAYKVFSYSEIKKGIVL
ncbi:sialidase-3-like isoform X1 [Sebastes fasciatus]|uniref:sialidase-3-like isoform X1 n=1 Tax=Sebastes fasciatus TaxID=394691 RepID=UPI003D9F97D1